MDQGPSIEGVKLKLLQGAIALEAVRPLRVLSSAVLNGGLVKARSIVNLQVPRGFCHPKPEGYLEEAVRRLGLKRPAVGLMTAVDVRNASVKYRELSGLKVMAVVTAGLSHAVAPGDGLRPDGPRPCGTINIILLVDAKATDGCLVNLAQTVTEAKADALAKLDVRSTYSGRRATGTVTDALAVACTGRGEKVRYAGLATELGKASSALVQEAVRESAEKEEGIASGRSVLRRLGERRIGKEDLVKAATELAVKPGMAGGEEALRELMEAELERQASDPNVASLLLAALRLQEDGEEGLIPGLSKEAFLEDPVSLVADEQIGMAIADYIAGSWGVFNFIRYDEAKPGILRDLGPFLDDAIGGLLAGTATLVFKMAREGSR